jgi:hypothetical protein
MIHLHLWPNFDPHTIDPTTRASINQIQTHIRTNLAPILIKHPNPRPFNLKKARFPHDRVIGDRDQNSFVHRELTRGVVGGSGGTGGGGGGGGGGGARVARVAGARVACHHLLNLTYTTLNPQDYTTNIR